MARKRMLMAAWYQDAGIQSVSPYAKLLFVALVADADDEGRLWESQSHWKDYVFSGRRASMDKLMEELSAAGIIVRYDTCSSGRKAILIPEWFTQQRIQHPAFSTVPLPPKGILARQQEYCAGLLARCQKEASVHRYKEWKPKFKDRADLVSGFVPKKYRTEYDLDKTRTEQKRVEENGQDLIETDQDQTTEPDPLTPPSPCQSAHQSRGDSVGRVNAGGAEELLTFCTEATDGEISPDDEIVGRAQELVERMGLDWCLAQARAEMFRRGNPSLDDPSEIISWLEDAAANPNQDRLVAAQLKSRGGLRSEA